MSFAEFETSLQNGRPVRLYQFQRGPLKWGYTNADRNISHQGITFRAPIGGISDDGIRQTENTTSDLLTLTMSAELDIPKMYRVVAPAQTISVTIFDLHYGDNGFLVVWMGMIVGVKFPNDFTASVQCQTLAASLEQTGLRKTWTRICPHQLYNPDCGVARNSFRTDGQINSLDGVSINFPSAAAKTDGWYSGGYVEWTSQYGSEQRGIELHQGAALSLYGGTSGLAAGQTVAIYAGCNRLFTTCQTKFNNVLNYGGTPHSPGKSPFDGTRVF